MFSAPIAKVRLQPCLYTTPLIEHHAHFQKQVRKMQHKKIVVKLETKRKEVKCVANGNGEIMYYKHPQKQPKAKQGHLRRHVFNWSVLLALLQLLRKHILL